MTDHSSVADFELGALLANLQPEVALYLRDHIRGLEAEAGTARGRLIESEEQRRDDKNRLTLHAAGLEIDRDESVRERDQISEALAAAELDAAAARVEMQLLESRLADCEAQVRLASTTRRRS